MIVKRKLKLTKVLRRKQKLLKRALLKPGQLQRKKDAKKKDLITLLEKGRKRMSPAMGKRWKKGKGKFKGRGAKAYFVYLIMPRLFILKRQYRLLARRIYRLTNLFSFYKVNKPLPLVTSRIKDRDFTIIKPVFNGILRYRVFNILPLFGRKCSPVFTFRSKRGIRRFKLATQLRDEFIKAANVWSGKFFLPSFLRTHLLHIRKRRMESAARFIKRSRKFFRRTHIKLKKKKNKFRVRSLSRYKFVVRRVYNNTFLTVSDTCSGDVFEKISGGAAGLKGSRRSSFVALERIVSSLVKDTVRQPIVKRKFDIYLQVPFLDRAIKTSVRSINDFRLKVSKRKYRRIRIRNIIVNRKKCHNGIRLPKRRRV